MNPRPASVVRFLTVDTGATTEDRHTSQIPPASLSPSLSSPSRRMLPLPSSSLSRQNSTVNFPNAPSADVVVVVPDPIIPSAPVYTPQYPRSGIVDPIRDKYLHVASMKEFPLSLYDRHVKPGNALMCTVIVFQTCMQHKLTYLYLPCVYVLLCLSMSNSPALCLVRISFLRVVAPSYTTSFTKRKADLS